MIQNLHIELQHLIYVIDLWERMGFVFLSMEESMEVVLNNKKLDHPWIHFTFDDGYKNNFTILYPYLKSKNIPFTIFLSARNMVEQRRFDRYKILCSLTHTRLERLRTLLLEPYRHQLSKTTSRDAETQMMVHLFKFFSVPDKEVFLEKVESLLTCDEWKHYNHVYESEEVLSLNDIAILSKDPLVQFGSHGYNHYILSTLNDEQINFEQTHSRKIIQQLTGKIPQTYCYPNGRVGIDIPGHIDILSRENHYTASFTTQRKKYMPGMNPYLIPRVPVSYHYMPKLFLDIL